MSVNLNGEAPANCKIAVVNDEGAVIGETLAGATGEWSIAGADLGAGHHTIKAIAKNDNGRTWESPRLEVTVEASTASDLGHSSLGPDEMDELNELREAQQARAEGLYATLVMSLVDGFEIDSFEAENILAAAGRTVEDLENDLGRLDLVVAQRNLQELFLHARIDALNQYR